MTTPRTILASVAVAAAVALGAGAAGWVAVTVGTGAPVTKAVAQVPADEARAKVPAKLTPAEAPARAPGKGDHSMSPADEAALEAIIASASKDLAAKLGVTQVQLRQALETTKAGVKPTESDALTLRTGSAEARAAVIKGLEARGVASFARTLGLPQADVVAAINQVKAAHFAQNEALLRARLDQAVKAGELTQAQADDLFAKAKQATIGG